MLLRSNDYIFYPLILIAAAAMIAIPLVTTSADRVGVAEDIRDNGIEISGDRLHAMAIAEGLTLAPLQDENGTLFSRITANLDRLGPTTPRSAGVFDALRPYEIEAIAGYNLLITYRMQAARENGADAVDLAFFQDGIGQSAWQNFELVAGVQDYEYRVSVPYCNPTFAYAGLWPSAASAGNAVDLYGIRIETTGEADCTDLPR
ncbi:hypothetical protein [Hyphobacterium sp.]|uniref:hypothetical protein n=1 Tax=Hyphobacterium sp. TaxID=2004662 RepID=UPI003BABAEE3